MSSATDTDLYAAAGDVVLWFGKYKGCTVDMVADTDPSYLVWAHENVEGFKLTKARYKELQIYADDMDEDYNEGFAPLDFS